VVVVVVGAEERVGCASPDVLNGSREFAALRGIGWDPELVVRTTTAAAAAAATTTPGRDQEPDPAVPGLCAVP
jgi:hypothetical protein